MKLKNKLAKKRLFFLSLAFVLFLLPSKLAFAEDEPISSDSANQEENENSTINTIKKVIQEKKTELGTVGTDLKSEKAYLAKVLRVSEETLTVNNYSGNKIIPLVEDVVIEKNGKESSVSAIAVDNWVGIYAEKNNDNLKIKKVFIYEKDFSPKTKMITLGSISMIGKSDIKVSPRSGGEELSFSFNKNTKFQDYQGETAKLTDFYEDLQCLIVAFADNNGNYTVSTLRALSTFDK